jgi:hypothetical protein
MLLAYIRSETLKTTCKDQASYAKSFRIFEILAKPLFRNSQSLFSSCFDIRKSMIE